MQSPTVLIVEDDRDLQHLLATNTRAHGYTALAAATVAEAVDGAGVRRRPRRARRPDAGQRIRARSRPSHQGALPRSRGHRRLRVDLHCVGDPVVRVERLRVRAEAVRRRPAVRDRQQRHRAAPDQPGQSALDVGTAADQRHRRRPSTIARSNRSAWPGAPAAAPGARSQQRVRATTESAERQVRGCRVRRATPRAGALVDAGRDGAATERPCSGNQRGGLSRRLERGGGARHRRAAAAEECAQRAASRRHGTVRRA